MKNRIWIAGITKTGLVTWRWTRDKLEYTATTVGLTLPSGAPLDQHSVSFLLEEMMVRVNKILAPSKLRLQYQPVPVKSKWNAILNVIDLMVYSQKSLTKYEQHLLKE